MMATPSQTSETPAASTTSKKSSITSDPELSTADKTDVKIVGAWVNKAHLVSDLSMLESGSFSDFTVICGKQEWKAHRLVLSRCSYFKPIVSEQSGFKETVESSITINGFEPFEIDWLLHYIYSLQIDCDQAQASSPRNSYLETCVLLWSLGNLFCLAAICQQTLNLLTARCKKLYIESRSISVTINKISFLPDIEAGIRAAWRADRVAGPARKQLLTVCCGLHPVLGDQESFISLLEEVPEFATEFLKALLGYPGMQAGSSALLKPVCHQCKSPVLDPKQGDGKKFLQGTFISTPFSVSIYSGGCAFYCSKKCYNKGRLSSWKYPDKPEEVQAEDTSGGVL
ncbi:hypothetical protein INS49_011966 [Diaporthe citri]|uniref:uncharacterized protein n=1 Tax=Diaporthe citri TaxID=83186 RepID=UPI001C817F5A|nr:uncharacterized protein INS49_011966 [Diaporthe citri]KAG6360898.1 hypothetical protein INS49_011966 [Diaporthe citri]